jgi:hypothetical protein
MAQKKKNVTIVLHDSHPITSRPVRAVESSKDFHESHDFLHKTLKVGVNNREIARLVVWNMNFIFHSAGNFRIPTDKLIFLQRG